MCLHTWQFVPTSGGIDQHEVWLHKHEPMRFVGVVIDLSSGEFMKYQCWLVVLSYGAMLRL